MNDQVTNTKVDELYCTSTWTRQSDKNMLEKFTYKLEHTPKWRVLKRYKLRGLIKMWTQIVERQL